MNEGYLISANRGSNNIWRHSHFLFIRSCNFNWIACVTSFFALSGASFFVHLLDYIFGQTWLTSLTKMTSSLWNWLLFTLIQRDKVKWVFLSVFLLFFRLQIYEAIAAIFWQSASFVSYLWTNNEFWVNAFKMSRDSPDGFIYQAIALPFSRSRVAFLLLGNPDVWFC